MKPVKIYTTPWCPYCVRAKRLLDKKGVSYQEIDVADDDEARVRLAEQTGRRTVPQIFIGEHHVGGSDDLHELEAQGRLDSLLTG
ncbi:MAG: glutaredoxin 3 [Deltaproteobacteria bacterium]|nr:MAG: glutaredoxin 3 [Deltaproteobacteria bacterium]